MILNRSSAEVIAQLKEVAQVIVNEPDVASPILMKTAKIGGRRWHVIQCVGRMVFGLETAVWLLPIQAITAS